MLSFGMKYAVRDFIYVLNYCARDAKLRYASYIGMT